MVLLTRANTDPNDNGGQVISILSVALIVITSVFMLVRLYVRGIVVRGLGWDDLFAVIAWVSFVECPLAHTANWRPSTDCSLS